MNPTESAPQGTGPVQPTQGFASPAYPNQPQTPSEAPQPAMPTMQQPAPQMAPAPASVMDQTAVAPVSGSSPLGLVALVLAVAGVISMPIIAGFASSVWYLLISLAIGAAAVVLAVMASKKDSLGSIFIILALTLGSTVSVMSFAQVVQGAIVKQRMQTQLDELWKQTPTSSQTPLYGTGQESGASRLNTR